MRASLRILYNLNDMNDDSAYIVVGNATSYWRENKLFIFDDTLLHQSFNETDQTRYCLFVDMPPFLIGSTKVTAHHTTPHHSTATIGVIRCKIGAAPVSMPRARPRSQCPHPRRCPSWVGADISS